MLSIEFHVSPNPGSKTPYVEVFRTPLKGLQPKIAAQIAKKVTASFP